VTRVNTNLKSQDEIPDYLERVRSGILGAIEELANFRKMTDDWIAFRTAVEEATDKEGGLNLKLVLEDFLGTFDSQQVTDYSRT
jgi:hypothetical protein